MAKLLFILALLSLTLAIAEQPKYELSPVVGYNLAETNLNIKNNGYTAIGLEIQRNISDSKFSSEFSLLYSNPVKYNSGQETNILRSMLNGIYTFNNIETVTPFVKLGFGYEELNNENSSNQRGFFMDAGVGAKIKIMKNLAIKLETIYINKHEMMQFSMVENRANDNYYPVANNFLTLVGLTFTFGEDN